MRLFSQWCCCGIKSIALVITNDSVIDVIGKVREEEWKREIDFVMRSKGVLAEVSREKRVVRRRGMRGESLCRMAGERWAERDKRWSGEVEIQRSLVQLYYILNH